MTTREKHTVTKSELVARLADKLIGARGVSDPQRAAEAAYEGMVELLAENIREAKGTSFRGVGIVTATRRPAKIVRLPQQSTSTVVPERIACNFDLVRTFAAELRAEPDAENA